MTIISEDSYYVLRFDRDAYNEKFEAGAEIGDEGVEEAFELVAEVSEKCVHFLAEPTVTNSYLAFRPVDGSEIVSSIQLQATS